MTIKLVPETVANSSAVVDMREMLQKTISLLSFKADVKQVTLECELDATLASFYLDPIILNQLLSSCIGYAVRFSPHHSQVYVKVERNTSGRKGTILFTVQDFGMGFDDESPSILHLHHLSKLLGGEFWRQSAPGVGSIFSFTVNAEEAFVEKKSQIMATQDETLVLPLKILLVDDSLDNRNLILAYLRKYPFHIRTAENGLEALKLMKEDHYDLVFMDIQMPIMDGLTATRKFRLWEKENHMSHLPIAALTAFALKDDHTKSLDAGCDLHITKPVKKVTILETIKELINKAA